ncbi:MAG: GTPase HflX [Gallintestinimicrobium sp.]|uniref:GTPase HflX n=1 Tax=Gallintestinimicrobium sp. TaxID=2981655 RepID=UPI003995AC85
MQKAILVGVNLNENLDFDHSMEELENLAEACEIEAAAQIVQNLPMVNNAFYIGTGKVEEVKNLVSMLDADCVIFDNSLTPSQQRNLQNQLEVPVWDRTNLILEIFDRRARTKEARLQVESANLQYLLPRLVGMRDALSRQGGGAGAGGGAGGGLSNKGAGEKKLELDRRRIEKRISELNRELKVMEKDRETQRKRRKESELPSVALVGYTNAGKSTLMNKMLDIWMGDTEKKVLEKDMLFATLDTTVRRISPGDNRDFLLSDTVGFISQLPHTLVKAFRSTLEEACTADLLLQVVDFSDPHHREQMEVTQETLKELQAGQIPCLYVMNKADLVMEESELPKVLGDRIYLSAKQGIGLAELLELIQKKLFGDYRECTFLIPYTDGAAVSRLQEQALVRSISYEADGVLISVSCKESDAGRYAAYAVSTSDDAETAFEREGA